jgi:hypothetical protein
MEAKFELHIKLDSKGKKEFTLSEDEARELQTKLNALFGETKYIPYVQYPQVLPIWYTQNPYPGYDWYKITCGTSDGSENIISNQDGSSVQVSNVKLGVY